MHTGNARQSAGEPPVRDADRLAAAVKALVVAGCGDEAQERFGELVERHQRRASRLAYYYLRDRADADEAVQDAFVKAYLKLGSFDETLSFEVWLTRILVNGCLDRLKARKRRLRWLVPVRETQDAVPPCFDPASEAPSPEGLLLRDEASRGVRAAIDALPDRQRQVVLLTQLDGRPAAEVSQVTGLRESTVRVHLFRAMKKLRQSMGRLGEAERPAGQAE